jgi:acyl-coenzyme A thioesterase PaaI-like protein
MTDLPSRMTAVPARLGTTARFDERGLVIDLTPQPEVLHHGIVRASVVAYAIDCVSGITLDGDEDTWTFTTDMTVRMQPVPAPAQLSAINTILRRGRRSATCTVSVVDDGGAEVATGAIGFAHVPRKPDAPPKIMVKPEEAPALFQGLDGLEQPLRDAAGIVTLDAAAGIVEIAVIPEVCNPAGTLQGAMVALVAEVAAEELLAARHGGPVVVTELDLRYLQQAGAGPVRSHARALGGGPDAAVEVTLVDTATDRITTLVYARAVPLPGR